MDATKAKAEERMKAHFFSGEPGTTGREPFEESTASGPAAQYLTGGHSSSTTQTSAPSTGYGQGTAYSGASQGTQYGQSGLGTAGTAGTGTTASSGTTRGGPTTGVASGVTGMSSEGHHHGHHGHGGHHGHHSHENDGHIAGATAGATTGAAAASATSTTGATSQSTGTGYPTDRSSATAGSTGLGGGHNAVGGATSQTTGAGYGGQSGQTGAHTDRVGALGQDQALYERTGDSGPISSGAAGTDRFDTDKVGSGTGAHSGQYADGVQQDSLDGPRAPGKSSGGIMGVLGTSDKDFVGRERLGQGAYQDTSGPFKTNTSGPAGNTALTGREGNLANNPVAKAASRDSTTTGATGTTAGTTAHSGTSPSSPESGEKKGFMQKVKDALKDV